MAGRRERLAKRRRARGHSQESLAEALRIDRSTVVRWERGETEPQPYIRPKLAKVLALTPGELDILLAPPVAPTVRPAVIDSLNDSDAEGFDDMNRRELLRLLSVAGTLVALSPPREDDTEPTAHTPDLDEWESLGAHLWQVFALSTSKSMVYPLVRQQLSDVTAGLEETRSPAQHERLCALAANLFQLAGEIFFDANRYTDAAHCYTLAMSASKEAGAHDLWACALTRHAFVGLNERRFLDAASMLEAAARVARLGDSQLSTRHWVAAVQAEALAGLGDLSACNRALESAEDVHTLNGDVHNGGWLRFDGSRLAEERGTCYVRLGRPDLAEAALSEALDQKLSLRRRGSVLTDLALLGVQRHDVDQVLHYGDAAVALAQQTGSGYIGRRLQGLQGQLAPLLTNSRASGLHGRISQITSVAG